MNFRSNITFYKLSSKLIDMSVFEIHLFVSKNLKLMSLIEKVLKCRSSSFQRANLNFESFAAVLQIVFFPHDNIESAEERYRLGPANRYSE